jgi:hypothetical protein
MTVYINLSTGQSTNSTSVDNKKINAVVDDARMSCANFTVVTGFWTSKVQATKYVGLRVYFIDTAFKFTSVLLGTRPFNPLFV